MSASPDVRAQQSDPKPAGAPAAAPPAQAAESGEQPRFFDNVTVSATLNPAKIKDTPGTVSVIDAVTDITGQGHINLIETLAEAVCERCLADPRIAAMRIRIEKLERGPVRGVELFRTRPVAP